MANKTEEEIAAEKAAAEKAAAEKAAAKNPKPTKVKVTGQGISEQGVFYAKGETFETTKDRAAALGGFVEVVPA